MKKILTIMTISIIVLVGCDTSENITTKKEKIKTSTDYYKDEIKKLTDKDIYKMIVEDYDNDGEKEAFILANKEEKKENKFELWFLSGKNSQKLSDEFVATEDTTIELFIKNKNYIIFNVAQLRQNDSMYTEIYKVKENKAVKVFEQNKINLFLENEELYAYDYSYSVLQPEFNEWMSLSQQKYHIKWNGKKEMCQDYDVKTLSEEKFSKISKADDVKNLIKKQIKKRYGKKTTNIEYKYFEREDKSVDINIIVTTKDGSKYKHYVSTSVINNTLGTNIIMSEGNKEIATFKMFIGKNEKDFNVTRNNAYNYNINLNLADASDKRITIEKIPLEGIAAEANCYILNPNSEHELLVPVKRVNAFWGTEEGGFKTDHMLNDGNNQGKVTKWVARIITKDSSKELLKFTTQQGSSANDYIGIKPTGNEGNVLIGIYDATAGEPAQDAKPLWSWHIWITDYNPGGDINGIIPAISQNPGNEYPTASGRFYLHRA